MEFLILGQLKIFKMAATKWDRFVMEMFISGREHELHILGFWSMAFNMFRP